MYREYQYLMWASRMGRKMCPSWIFHIRNPKLSPRAERILKQPTHVISKNYLTKIWETPSTAMKCPSHKMKFRRIILGTGIPLTLWILTQSQLLWPQPYNLLIWEDILVTEERRHSKSCLPSLYAPGRKLLSKATQQTAAFPSLAETCAGLLPHLPHPFPRVRARIFQMTRLWAPRTQRVPQRVPPKVVRSRMIVITTIQYWRQ